MRKMLIGLFVSMLILAGCGNTKSDEGSAKDILNLFDNEDTFILVVGSTTCSSCIEYEEVIKDVKQDYTDAPFQHVYVDKEPTEMVDGKEVKTDLLALYSIIGDVKSTPSIFFVVKGQIKQTENTVLTKEETIQIMKKLGIVE